MYISEILNHDEQLELLKLIFDTSANVLMQQNRNGSASVKPPVQMAQAPMKPAAKPLPTLRNKLQPRIAQIKRIAATKKPPKPSTNKPKPPARPATPKSAQSKPKPSTKSSVGIRPYASPPMPPTAAPML